MDTRFDRVMAYDMRPILKKITSLLVKSSSHSSFFFHLIIVPFISHKATMILVLLAREKEPPILTFLNLYENLNEIHGSI